MLAVGIRPHVEVGWLDAEGGERRRDLAAVVGPVLDHLGETDAQRGVARGAVVAVAGDLRVEIEVPCEQRLVALPERRQRSSEIGDGRVFVLPVLESYRIRTGERES